MLLPGVTSGAVHPAAKRARTAIIPMIFFIFRYFFGKIRKTHTRPLSKHTNRSDISFFELSVSGPERPRKTGVPCLKSKYRLNFWHTNNWPVETNPLSVEAPRYPYELEIDWMSYTPFDKYNPYLK